MTIFIYYISSIFPLSVFMAKSMKRKNKSYDVDGASVLSSE